MNIWTLVTDAKHQNMLFYGLLLKYNILLVVIITLFNQKRIRKNIFNSN